VLSQEKDNSEFQLAILPISITYLHRDQFRSNVLVKISQPLILSPRSNPELIKAAHASSLGDGSPTADFMPVRALTSKLEAAIRSGCLEATTWRVMRIAHTARRLYAPGGPATMSLSEYVALTQVRFSFRF
jgi:glycerol-3-phosphate O-acyltransferase / dihydroxyacetone phosphate acyltransferase